MKIKNKMQIFMIFMNIVKICALNTYEEKL